MKTLYELALLLLTYGSLFWLLLSAYFRFFKKRPLRFEHSLLKIWLINREVGKTRLYRASDALTIGLTLVPWAIKYPDFSTVIIVFFITIVFILFMHSLCILMQFQKHKSAQRVAQVTLLVSIGLIIWDVIELISVF